VWSKCEVSHIGRNYSKMVQLASATAEKSGEKKRHRKTPFFGCWRGQTT
jgi:hypothetical protein